MIKNIEFVGKRNTDKINKIENPIRKDSEKWNFNDTMYTYNKQLEIINKLYLDNDVEDTDMCVKREIEKKLKGYKNQDIKKKIINDIKFISLSETIEMLMVSKLNCFYCRNVCELIYKQIFAKKQWTLDRINNNNGHNNDNVVICCYECNIKRGNMDINRFKKGKQIKIVRKLF
jgi:5-methylcytosine-specific restriction endonuclease McrA